MSEETYCYAAVDPENPDAAWSVCVDRPETPESRAYTANAVAEYVKKNAIVMRVPLDQARAMLLRWYDLQEAKRETA